MASGPPSGGMLAMIGALKIHKDLSAELDAKAKQTQAQAQQQTQAQVAPLTRDERVDCEASFAVRITGASD